MPSQSSNASWNPAFMPDTLDHATAPKVTKTVLPYATDASPPLRSPIDFAVQKSTASPFEEENHATPHENHSNGFHSESLEDNTDHPELANLRNALETSLASPGGVEMEENVWENGQTHPEDTENQVADFPSEGPPNGGKHLSTMSFTRTVSQDVNWGEDDDTESEFNFQRRDTDPFKAMANLDRTNSFPAVPPTHLPGINDLAEPLPSEVEHIMNDIEQEPKDLFSDDGNEHGGDFFAQQFHPTGPGVAGEQVPMEYNQVYGGDVPQGNGERYEEGVPLVSPEQNNNHAPLNHLDFTSHEADEDEDFFAQASQPSSAPGDLASKPQLERKSTAQVMNSMNFQPREATHQDLLRADSVSSGMPSGSNVATSDHSDNVAEAKTGSNEVDLVEKWKAALAEEEFLEDDDDFLPDDDEEAVPSKELDPTAIFGSDDEGFLEEAEDQEPPAPKVVSPIPPPLTRPNGHMGFDSLNGPAHMYSRRPSSSASSRYIPSGLSTVAHPPSNPYAPASPLLTDLSRSATTSSVPTSYMAQANSNFTPQPSRPDVSKAQSFVDKSKGGYSSPYDLPMEIVKPRKRVSMNQGTRPAAATNMAPPRSNVISGQRPPPSRGSTSSVSPPTSSQSMRPTLSTSAGQTPLPPKTIRKSQSGFFEELPMSSKPKLAARHSSSLGSPSLSPYGHPSGAPPPSGSQFTPQMQQMPSQGPPPVHGLVAPERVNPYATLPPPNGVTPATGSRYSPAPPSTQSLTAPPPVSTSRYSPAPSLPRQLSYGSQPMNAPPPPQMLPHQPRTSSPLAHFERGLDGRSRSSHSERGNFDRRSSSSHESNLRPYHLPPTREVDEGEQASGNPKRYGELQNHYAPPPVAHPGLGLRQVSPPSSQADSSSRFNSPKRVSSNYAPQPSSQAAAPPPTYTPLQRSQTQSPGNGFAATRLETSKSDPYPGPASIELPPSPPKSLLGGTAPPMTYPHARSRGASQTQNYLAPTDGTEHDPLQRWKGAPVFAWGVGGTIMTSFPKDVPRYGLNHSTPMIVRSPGQVKIRNIKDVDPLPERLTTFPGPLKGKAKKKEVVAWLAAGIAILEQNASYLRTLAVLSHEDKRIEERILLWKILRVFIEFDGTLEGNPTVEKAVRGVLSPNLEDLGSSTTAPLYATGAELSGISQSSTIAPRSDPVDPAAVDQLRKHLLRGEREKAVWDAVDKRLWAHAMLISNTVSKDLYKQVCQEFVQKEVKNIGDNTEPLAALYEVFAGNFVESIDELVPPSARAGFQMVSTSNTVGPSKDAMTGLDRWRETLGLVLSNRSVDDSVALNALGKLLSGYGRAEAAHICFLFARSHTVFGGIDDPLSSFVLVGSDHLRQPYEFDREMEPILLSEVFEYGLSLANTSTLPSSSPHLAVYKLQHAKILAEYGFRDKALEYCESIGASIYSQTRRSPYHHALLTADLDDFAKRLKSSPKDDSASWISKPSIDKAKGSVWATFNKFVAGEEADSSAASNAGSSSDIGPFARIAGGTPTISRNPSSTDLYGAYGNGMNMNGSMSAPPTKATSRYAPGAAYSSPQDPQSANSYASQPRSSLEERSSGEYRRYEPQSQLSPSSDYRPSSQPTSQANHPPIQMSASYTPQSSFGPYGNPPLVSEPTKTPKTPTEQGPMGMYSSPQPMNNFDGYHPSSSYAPSDHSSRNPSSNYEPFGSSFEPHESAAPETKDNSEAPVSNGYEPPSYGSYEPPTGEYEPYQPATMDDEEDSPVDKPKKKSFMDDDEDDIPGLKAQSAPAEKTKAEKDREADEAFRRAAEADAQKAKEAAPVKKGWGLGGWFGGGAKKESTDMGAQPNKPIRAKLGEASSFVYDPDLKRWINKKAGAETPEARTATPPPPKAGPPRMHNAAHLQAPMRSSSMGPPIRNISNLTELVRPGTSAGDAPTGGLAPPMMSRTVSNGSIGGPSAPPSRPGTSMSNASSIDDLLGPPLPRKAGAGKAAKRRGRGYVDVMGEKTTSS